MTEAPDRDTFGLRQAEMTARWFENVKRQHGDVDAYIRTLFAAYLDRWREAARFIPVGSRLLDIGGGNLFEELIHFFKGQRYRYRYIDVDPSSVASSQAIAYSLGMNSFTFQQGFNDLLPFLNSEFDAVFSSHCIEHSFDLPEVVTHGETGILIPVGDTVALEAALTRLIIDTDLRTHMGKAARRDYERRFTDTAMRDGVIAIVDNLSVKK